MKFSFLILLFTFCSTLSVNAQTAHEFFMQSKVKMNQNNNPNYWVHGDNSFKTETNDNWNKWVFNYLGLEGDIQTVSNDDFTSWKVDGTDIVIEQNGTAYNNWTISGEKKTINLSTANWNTWVYTGDLISGLSTTVTDDFSEWEIQNGDWTELSPHLRASVLFISTISSTILKDFSM